MLEHIAAQSGGFSSRAFAAAAVEDIFTAYANGIFSAMKVRHCPKAYLAVSPVTVLITIGNPLAHGS